MKSPIQLPFLPISSVGPWARRCCFRYRPRFRYRPHFRYRPCFRWLRLSYPWLLQLEKHILGNRKSGASPYVTVIKLRFFLLFSISNDSTCTPKCLVQLYGRKAQQLSFPIEVNLNGAHHLFKKKRFSCLPAMAFTTCSEPSYQDFMNRSSMISSNMSFCWIYFQPSFFLGVLSTNLVQQTNFQKKKTHPILVKLSP